MRDPGEPGPGPAPALPPIHIEIGQVIIEGDAAKAAPRPMPRAAAPVPAPGLRTLQDILARRRA